VRQLRRTGAAILIAVILLAFGPPLVVRGPVLRWAFARVFAHRCGHFSIGGGHFDWAAVARFALGRPISVAIDRLVITDPNDKPVLEAARVEASVLVELFPLRIEVRAARISDGFWRLASAEDGRGTADSFARIPAGGRSACLVPIKELKPGAHPGAGSRAQIRIEHARLEDLDIDLDFPDWQLEAFRVTTSLQLSLDRILRFGCGRIVAAGGGRLRIGPVGSEWTTTAPFDHIALDSLGTLPETASDLVLVLDNARTGRSALSGRAVFHQVFPSGLPRAPPAGLDVVARWRSIGDAVSRLRAAWLPRAESLRRFGRDLQFDIHGPYDELSATAEIRARGAWLEAELVHGLANLRLSCSGADTSSWFEPALGRLLGGQLHGGLLASLRLAPSFAGLAGEIQYADLRLERAVTTRGPRTIVLRIGPSQPSPHTPSSLSAGIRKLRLADCRLRLSDAQAAWMRWSARAEASIDFDPSDWIRSRVDARGTLAVGSIADWIPARIARGRFRVAGELAGTLHSLRLQARFSSQKLVLGGERLRLPSRLTLAWGEATGLVVPRLPVRAGGGTLELGGRLGPDDFLDAQVTLSHYSLTRLPWFPSGHFARSFGAVLSGRLFLKGPVGKPFLSGRILAPSLDFRGRSIGAATATLAVGKAGGDADLRVGGSLAARLNLRYLPRLAMNAEISLHRLALPSWLFHELPVPPLAASGTIHLAYRESDPLVGLATLALEGPGLEGVRVAARSQAEDITANITGQVALAPWSAIWSPTLTAAQGTIGVEVRARHDRRGTRLSGDVLIVRDVALHSSGGYGPIRLLAGAKLGFEDDSFTTPGLRVELPWFHGRVAGRMTVNPSDLPESHIDAGVVGMLDVGALPVKLPANLTLGGHAAVQAVVSGSLGPTPGPQIRGQVGLEQVRIKLPDFPPLVLDGLVHAQGDRLSTEALAIDATTMGRITIGAPESPAWAVVVSLLPFRLGQVDARLSGTNLVLDGQHSPVEIRDLDIDVRLLGPPGARSLVGQVDVSRGSFHRSRVKARSKAQQRPWYRSLPPGWTVDLGIKGFNRAMRIAVPMLPYPTIDFDCRLRATQQGAHWSGRVYGAGLYDRMALQLYSWFGDSRLLRCQLGSNQ